MSGLWLTMSAVRVRFPAVQQVGTDTAHDWLCAADKRPPGLLLLDTRADAEFSVSRLPGAEQLSPELPDDQLQQRLQQLLAERPAEGCRTLLCYCSVGYRSSGVAARLNALPQADQLQYRAANLEGSIFKWANEHRPLLDAHGHTTSHVHPYNSVFGKMLNSELWKFPDNK